MDVFTVTKPGGTKTHEFEAYTRLLEEIGGWDNSGRILVEPIKYSIALKVSGLGQCELRFESVHQ